MNNIYTQSKFETNTFQKLSKRSKYASCEDEQDNKRGYSKQNYKQQRYFKRSWEVE